LAERRAIDLGPDRCGVAVAQYGPNVPKIPSSARRCEGWSPTLLWDGALAVVFVLTLAVLSVKGYSEFLYFQF
jgi:hypothetical protein